MYACSEQFWMFHCSIYSIILILFYRRKRQTLSDMIGGESYMDDIDAGVAANEQSVTIC